MGVRPCEIELRRFLLLIGEQASGKSTIAKLIFFFQTLPDALYESAITARQKGSQFDYVEHINIIARQKFLETFGPTSRNDRFEIIFQYAASKKDTLQIFQGKDRKTYALFASDFGYKVGGTIKGYLNALKFDQPADEIFHRQNLKAELDELFCRETTQHTYLIAGRNTIVGYPDTFEKVIDAEYQKLLEDEVKEEDFEKRQRLGNERLLYQFVQWSKGVRNNFKNNGQTFQRVAYSLENRQSLTFIQKIAESILKGTYRSGEWGEQIELKGSNLKVALKDASSGQQEVLRLLQGIFLAIGLKNRKEFFVVEEPEAHLYPLAQKELINAYAVFLNTIPQGRLIITTHSPYILACINILLMAAYVAGHASNGMREQAVHVVDEHFRLKAGDFNAYSLSHSSDPYCTSIKDEETGMIDQNFLDVISEELGMQFQQLYEALT